MLQLHLSAGCSVKNQWVPGWRSAEAGPVAPRSGKYRMSGVGAIGPPGALLLRWNSPSCGQRRVLKFSYLSPKRPRPILRRSELGTITGLAADRFDVALSFEPVRHFMMIDANSVAGTGRLKKNPCASSQPSARI